MNQARKIARVKGVRDGIQLTVDPQQPLEVLLPEVLELFRQMQHLASRARVAIEGIQGEPPPALIEGLEQALKKEFAIHSVRLRSPSEEKDSPPPPNATGRPLTLGRSINPHRTEGLILAGRVRSGQTIKARKHLVILGDVNPGAEVEAGGDILILGTLGGKASAGMPDSPEAIILALDLRPTQLQIGGIVAAGEPGTRGNGMEYARVESGRIVVADYKQANPFKGIQWPEMR
ncbi:MAG: septum site-determining protein MinC [Desulfobacterales bacterium]